MEVRSNEYQQHLRRRYYRELRRVPSEQALSGAVAVTEAEALEQGESVKLGLRFYQERDDLVWIDLGDATGRAVRITPAGWDLVSVPPVLFRRFPHMSALPEPVSGGSLADLFQFINLKREEDRITLLPWLVTVPLADMPRQLLLLHGTQGSGKSVAARMLRSLLDPCRPDLLGLANGELETAQILDHNALPIFDNLTTIPPWASDLFCRAVTGGGISKRSLYSNAEDFLMVFQRTAVFTAVHIPTDAPDLLDRTLSITLERLSGVQRQEEVKLWAAFELARPKLFGALLDALSGAMSAYPTIRLTALPRMADAAVWGAAAAVALGIPVDRYEAALTGNLTRQAEDLLEADLLGVAVMDLMTSVGRWEGTASELLTVLTRRTRPEGRRGWPQKPDWLSRRVAALVPLLREVSIMVEYYRGTGGRRIIRITSGRN